MQPQINRRRAMAVGAAGLGTLLTGLIGCGGPSDGQHRAGTGRGAGAAGQATESSTTAAPVFDAAALAGRFGAVNGCSLSPQTIAGPSYIAIDTLRSDIRDDRQGVALRLGLRVLDEACTPIAGAAVELWNCDASGLYSGYAQRDGDTSGLTYCRGTQVTDANGIVAFSTVYPGWYRTRAPHLHTKVLLTSTELLTTQLFLDDAVSATVFAGPPYSSHTGQDTFNDTDRMFQPATVLSLSPDGDGYLGLLNLTVQRA